MTENRQSPPERLEFARRLMESLPSCRELRMKVGDVGPGTAAISMPYDDRLVGDPATGVIHGGAVSALMDSTAGAAVMNHPEASGATATIDLRVDYMRPAAPGQRLRAEAECHHVTRSVAFVRVTAWDDDRDLPVATGVGGFTVDRGREAG